MKRILIPTDFSECADHALNAAGIVAKKVEAEVYLLHVVDTPIDWMSLGGENQKKLYPDIMEKVKSVNNKLTDLTKRLKAKGVNAHHYIEYNNDYKSIIKFASSFNIDLIIMGTKGASGLKEMFIGSLAQKIVRLSHCPVLVVEHIPSDFDLSEVVIASDMSSEGLNGFAKAINLIRQLEAKAHLVFINTPVTFTDTDTLNKKWLRYKEEADDLEIEFSVYNAYDFEEGLGDFARQNGDLLMMMSHGKSGGLTEKMVNHLDVPILSVSA